MKNIVHLKVRKGGSTPAVPEPPLKSGCNFGACTSPSIGFERVGNAEKQAWFENATTKPLDKTLARAESKAVMPYASQRYSAVPIISNRAITLDRAFNEISEKPKWAFLNGELQFCKSDPGLLLGEVVISANPDHGVRVGRFSPTSHVLSGFKYLRYKP